MKVRGTSEDIVHFLKTALTPVPFTGDPMEAIIKEGNGYIELRGPDKTFAFYVEDTRRNFVRTKIIEWYELNLPKDQKQILLLEDYEGAWSIEADALVELSKKYNLDFKIYAFEGAMEFNQDIEIINGEIVKNDFIKFDDYSWECTNPRKGG